MIRTKISEFENFGRVLEIYDGVCTVKITLDIGPRVIYCALDGKKNVFFADVDRGTVKNVSEMDEYYGPGRYWYLYGGYRLWMSPESLPRTYYPDNDPVQYEINGDTVIFTPAPQSENGIALSFSMTFKGNGVITVKNTIKNISPSAINGAVWTLSVMARNTVTAALQSQTDTGLLPNRTLVLWPYTDIFDKRLSINNRLVCVKQNPEPDKALKVGFNNERGTLVTVTDDGCAFIQKYATDHKNGKYPDGGCSCEIYSCPDFTEAETLSPLQTFGTGQSIEHTVKWEITSADAGELSAETLENIIKRVK